MWYKQLQNLTILHLIISDYQIYWRRKVNFFSFFFKENGKYKIQAEGKIFEKQLHESFCQLDPNKKYITHGKADNLQCSLIENSRKYAYIQKIKISEIQHFLYLDKPQLLILFFSCIFFQIKIPYRLQS